MDKCIEVASPLNYGAKEAQREARQIEIALRTTRSLIDMANEAVEKLASIRHRLIGGGSDVIKRGDPEPKELRGEIPGLHENLSELDGRISQILCEISEFEQV